MAKYDEDDVIDCYFIINKTKVLYNEKNNIKAWSTNKALVDYYMAFHRCKDFKVKKFTMQAKDMMDAINEAIHDEIKICNINTRDPKNPHKVKIIQIPATDTEIMFLNEETNSLLSTFIEYSDMNVMIPYLKKKYRHALSDILLADCIKRAIHNKPSKVLESIDLDQLALLVNFFPEDFGN